jgi:uncharacterized protein (DUF1786 family)
MRTTDVELRAEEFAHRVRHEARSAPYRTLALGLVAGYVLGGGLTPRAMRVLLLAGGRLMAANLVAAALRGTFDHRTFDQRRNGR